MHHKHLTIHLVQTVKLQTSNAATSPVANRSSSSSNNNNSYSRDACMHVFMHDTHERGICSGECLLTRPVFRCVCVYLHACCVGLCLFVVMQNVCLDRCAFCIIYWSVQLTSSLALILRSRMTGKTDWWPPIDMRMQKLYFQVYLQRGCRASKRQTAVAAASHAHRAV